MSARAELKGMTTLRMTAQSHNLGSAAGNAKALEDLRQLIRDGHKVHLWASLPCRPWSQLAEMNGRKLGRKFRQYLSVLWDESMVLLGF